MNWRSLLLLLFVAASVALAWRAQHVVYDLLVVPLWQMAALAGLVFQSLPQPWIWAAFLAVAALIAFRRLAEGRIWHRPSRYRAWRAGGLLSDWSGAIERAHSGDYFNWLLARRIAQLAIELLADRRQLSPDEVRRQILADEIAAPAEVREYLKAGLKALALPRAGEVEPQGAPPPPFELNRVIRFLEDSRKV